MRAFETPEAARPLLASLALVDVRIYAVVVDKHRSRERSPAALLAMAYAACTTITLQAEGGIIATIDRPFTSEQQRQDLLLAMADAAEELDKRLVVVMDDSQHGKALQAADVVAWAFFQKYERGNAEFCRVVGERVSTELLLP
jgi:hypothetical protein